MLVVMTFVQLIFLFLFVLTDHALFNNMLNFSRHLSKIPSVLVLV